MEYYIDIHNHYYHILNTNVLAEDKQIPRKSAVQSSKEITANPLDHLVLGPRNFAKAIAFIQLEEKTSYLQTSMVAMISKNCLEWHWSLITTVLFY